MYHLQKLKTPSFLRWVSSHFPQIHFKSPETHFSLYLLSLHFTKNPAFYSSRAETIEKGEILEKKTKAKHPSRARSRLSPREEEAQSALLENLNGTRSIPFLDAEYMSKNCPIFLNKLMKKAEGKEEIARSLSKLFCYDPINEFEPFFECMGFAPSEMVSILPRNMIFLKDDPLLLENYHALCNYGVSRSLIGKFYKEASEIFRYDHGVLCLKLQAYEHLGLSRPSVIKVVVSCPPLLIGIVSENFIKILDLLRSLDVEFKLIEKHLSDKNFYNWSHMFGLLSLICEMGCSKEDLGMLLKRYPGFLLDGSGRNAFCLVVFLLKVGSTTKEISSLLSQLPRVQLGAFVKNLKQCLFFLLDIEMDARDIGMVVRAHSLMLGSCSLKQTKSILTNLNVGKKRLCNIIMEDPCQIKKWILGLRVEPLPNSGEDERSLILKTEFLLKLGFVENSNELKKALKMFRGRGSELQERFDCFIKAGLDRKDVVEIIKTSPQILSQTKDVIEQKLDYLLNELGYNISSLVAFPSYMSYTIERVKLRISMYDWLKNEGLTAPNLALSTIIACTENKFIKQYVKRHPGGLEVWEKLKK